MVLERLKRKAALSWVPLEKMRVREEISQRKFDQNWANAIAKNFQLEEFGTPTMNRSGEWFWIVDGQHRVAALKQWLGEWKGQKIECWVYHNLAEQEEADLFLALSKVKAIGAFDKFKIALTARHETETNIQAIVRKNGLKVARKRADGGISCVATLAKVYRRGADCLDRTLKIANGAFGDAGLDADIIGGLGLLIGRYDGRLDDEKAIKTFSAVRNGIGTIRTRAAYLAQTTGVQRTHCIAAAAVEIINRGKGGKKLPTWWKSEGGVDAHK